MNASYAPLSDGAMPRLPNVAYVLRTGAAPHATITRLSELVRNAVEAQHIGVSAAAVAVVG